jgi:hypothetical protein
MTMENDMSKTWLTTLALGALALPAAALDADRLSRDIERSVTLALAEVPTRIALGDGALVFAGRELETKHPVKGAPYCATAVHENVQVLADGNRIVRQQRSQLCRDGEGRTRHEVQREGGPGVVYLNDPVAKASWVLYPDEKRMQRLRAPLFYGTAPDPAAHAAWQASMREWGERMKEQAARWKEWGARVAEEARVVDAERVRTRTLRGEPGVVIERDVVIPAAPGASAPQLRRELRVLRAGDMPAPPAPPAPPATMALPVPPMPPLLLPGPLTLALPREGGATTALPAKEIEGVKVNGERTTWTIEAGKIGNERPIVITREVWRSPDLMLTVASRDTDPRSGERNYRLENIRRGEPDAALMKPPADYSEGARRSAAPKAGAATRS